jgi:ketosteroid isomerase-like protein
MSQENVEIVRQAWVVFLDGIDRGNSAAPFDEGLLAPTCTLRPAWEVPGTRTYVGREGFLEFHHEWTEDFLDWKMKPEDIIDAGDDRVVAVISQSAKGKESGAAVELLNGIVYRLKGGQIIDQHFYLDPAQALEAVGLQF